MSRTSRQRLSGSPPMYRRSSEVSQPDLTMHVESHGFTPVESPNISEALLQVTDHGSVKAKAQKQRTGTLCL